MNRFAMGALVLLAFAGMASADVVTCPAPPNSGVPMNVVGLTAYCGGFTFSNFQVLPFGNNQTAEVYLGSINVADKWVSLTFNPSMVAAPGSGTEDIHLLYQVSGNPVDGVGVAVAGRNASVSQTACSAAIPTSGQQADLCPDSSLVANLIAFSSVAGSNQPQQNKSQQRVTPTSGVWAFRDISVSSDSPSAGGGALSSFTDSFRSEAVPEPAAFLLAGPALLGLLAFRRRKA